jgi:hypothetical protein
MKWRRDLQQDKRTGVFLSVEKVPTDYMSTLRGQYLYIWNIFPEREESAARVFIDLTSDDPVINKIHIENALRSLLDLLSESDAR